MKKRFEVGDKVVCIVDDLSMVKKEPYGTFELHKGDSYIVTAVQANAVQVNKIESWWYSTDRFIRMSSKYRRIVL